MKKFLLLLMAVGLTAMLNAQNADTLKPWKFGGIGSLMFNQAGFSNWSPGGENSFSGTAFVKLTAGYKKNNFSVDNELNMKYGLMKNASESMKKNEDLIELISQFNHKFSKNWSASGLINFATQFANGYNYPNDSTIISKFMAPGYLTLAPGIMYKPAECFSILFAPISMKTIFVMDQDLADAGAFGVNKADTTDAGGIIEGTGKNTKIKMGTFVEINFKKEIKTDLNIESKMNIFYNFLNDENIPNSTPKIDFNWKNLINYKFNKWFSANLFVHFAYMPGDLLLITDENGEPKAVPNDKLQVMETFGLGLSYNF